MCSTESFNSLKSLQEECVSIVHRGRLFMKVLYFKFFPFLGNFLYYLIYSPGINSQINYLQLSSFLRVTLSHTTMYLSFMAYSEFVFIQMHRNGLGIELTTFCGGQNFYFQYCCFYFISIKILIKVNNIKNFPEP